MSTQGFLRDSAQGPLRLPADAKGVLFNEPFSGRMLDMDRGGIIIESIPAPLSSQAFIITDETSHRKMGATMTRFKLPFHDPRGLSSRYFRLRSPKKAACLNGEDSEACRLFQRFRYDNANWVEHLLKNGELEDVTTAVEKSYGLFRVGPARGFAPGHDYTISFSGHGIQEQPGRAMYGQSIKLHIDLGRASPYLVRGFTLEPEGAQVSSMLPVSAGGSCSQSIPARVQRFKFAWEPELERYQNSILFFLTYAGEAGPYAWDYSSSACAQTRLGRTEAGFGKDLAYADCNDPNYGIGLARGRPYEFQGYAGMLEVEDSLRPTNSIPVTFDKVQCDVNEIVAQAGQGGSQAALVEQVCLLSRTSNSDPRRVKELLPTLAKLSVSADARGRNCVVAALKPLPYQFQNGGLDQDAQGQTLAILMTALKDSDSATRAGAAEGLRDFARILKLPSGEIPRAVAALSRALPDDDNAVRVPVAEALAALGPLAKDALNPLIAAVKDQERANYAAPRALVAIEPAAPEVLAALREALNHKDSIVRMTAAESLGDLGKRNGAAPVADLLAAARGGNGDAINALAKLGPAAKEAVPFLVEQAKTSQWSYIRKYALEALVSIVPQDPATLEAVTANLNAPVGEYGRQQALEVLGNLKDIARPAVPDMINIMDKNPNDYEMGTLVRALVKIGPPPEQVKPVLMRLLNVKARYIREETARYLIRIAPRDGGVIAKVLGDNEAGVIHEGLRALSMVKPGETVSHRSFVLKALAGIIRDDSRYSDTYHYAYSAAQAVATGDPDVCAAIEHRRDAEKTEFNRRSVESRLKRICP